MNPFSVIFALTQSLGFQIQAFSERRIQEYGASPIRTFALQKYALIPALIWSIIFVRISDIFMVLHTPILLGYFILIALSWNIQSFLFSYLLNTISSMSSTATLWYLLYLPLLLAVGTFFNHDMPGLYSFLGIGILLLAFIIQPTQHEKNIRARFSLPIISIIGFGFITALMNAVNGGMTRQALSMIRPEVFLGIFSILTMALCALWTSFVPHSASDTAIFKKRWLLAASVPLLWFLASIPETYSYAKLPIYTVVSIGAITFLLNTISDLYRNRIKFDFRTVIFIVLVLVGMGLAVYSI